MWYNFRNGWKRTRGSCMVYIGLKDQKYPNSNFSEWHSFSSSLFVCNCFSLLLGARRSDEEIKFGTALPPPLGINAPPAQFAGLVSKTEGGAVHFLFGHVMSPDWICKNASCHYFPLYSLFCLKRKRSLQIRQGQLNDIQKKTAGCCWEMKAN